MNVKEQAKKNMEVSFAHFKKEMQNLRTGRANPNILDSVVVEVYGSDMKIQDLASVSVAEGRQLVVSAYDAQTAGPIAKGIEKANLGFQPILEGGVVRVPIPPLNEELRKNIVKDAKKKAEDAKVSVREHRKKANDMIKKLKNDGEVTEDAQKGMEKKIQELTDQFCKDVDQAFKEKEKEIMTI